LHTQLSCVVAPATSPLLYLVVAPAWHDWQASCEDAPSVPLKVPIGQSTHALELLAPCRTPYFPIEHFVHTAGEVAGEDCEKVPAGQGMHTPLPASV
jgi:hypothetical protein